jgi:hypothetical protein
MTINFETTYLPEPDLVFGNQGEDKDPRIGLKHHGPYFYSSEDAGLESVRIGIIGNNECTSMARKIIKLIQDPVKSPKPNHWLFPDYPGMKKDSPFRCNLRMDKNWDASISDDYDLSKIEKVMTDMNERIAYGVNLYANKVEQIKSGDDVPNVIICTLPKIVEKYCGISEFTRGAKKVVLTQLEKDNIRMEKAGQLKLGDFGVIVPEDEKPKDKSYDFRNSLKGKVMKHGIPIQLIKESTMNQILNYGELKKIQKENPAAFSWNFSTALYYKANGKPWRLAKLRQDTCYVGISFFRDKLHPKQEIQISMAQVFTHNGEGLVLRGSEVDVNEHTKQAYLKKDQASALMKRALTKYIEKAQRNPSKVVIHKSSIFSPAEQEGFNEAIYELGNVQKDFVAIKPMHSGINFLRMGSFPVLRGTMIDVDTNEFLLYTSGYSPRIRSYAGHRVPNPIRIMHYGDSSKEEVGKEILGLTKINWNTTSFSTFLPITIKFADEVGKILSELKDDKELQDHYKFFM